MRQMLTLMMTAALAGCGGRSVIPVEETDLADGGAGRRDDVLVLSDSRAGADGGISMRDGGQRFCAGNAECGPTELCNLDGICKVTGAKMGRCEERPTSCPLWATPPPPVCGCDGKTYSEHCAAHMAGVSVAKGEPCELDQCDALSSDYAKALKEAKKCCLFCAVVQCTQKVPDRLFCSCETFVDASNSAALQKLSSLQKQWLALDCPSFIGACPPFACPTPPGASCAANSDVDGAGVCADHY